MQRSGFSLVELSIVLVILGLLTGGILAGQSLIRASELRAVTAETYRFVTAAQTFHDKYFGVPGDFADATKFWGRWGVIASCVSNSGLAVAGTPGACDGNGDGMLSGAVGASQSGENFQFWRHLMLSGLVEGNYLGLSGGAGANHSGYANNEWHAPDLNPISTAYAIVVATVNNIPRSKLGNGGWSVNSASNFAGSATTYAADYGNYLLFGGIVSGNLPDGAIFKPEEAWNIDTKMDDGKPGTGKVIAMYWDSACANSTANNDYTGTYRLTDSTPQCALYFAKAF